MKLFSCLRGASIASRCIQRSHLASARRTYCDAASVETYDVVVVGGGLVGATFACALRQSPLTAGLKVALLDRVPLLPPGAADDSAPAKPPSPRVSTITPANIAFLTQLGAWNSEVDAKAKAFSDMQVWDSSGSGHVRYSAHLAGRAHLGAVVENNVLLASLHQCIREEGQVDVLPPGSLDAMELPPYGGGAGPLAELALEGGGRVRARLVVGSDGGRSRVRQLAGLRTKGWAYAQHAVVSTVETDRPHTTAWQVFLPTGPLALLPISEQYSNIVWSTTPSQAQALAKASGEEFAAAVNRALVERSAPAASPTALLPSPLQLLPNLPELLHSTLAGAGRVRGGEEAAFRGPPRVVGAPGPRGAFPLALSHAHKYQRARLALIGDAAHTVHPLAGQGVNLGLSDCRILAEVLANGLETGEDIGGSTTLGLYERRARRANAPMMAALDGLQRLFAADSSVVALARGAGLSMVNSSPVVKQQIMKYAMGG